LLSKKLQAISILGIVIFITMFALPVSAGSTIPKSAPRPIDRSGRVSPPKALVSRGLSLVGTRYKWGGVSYRGVDCSGLMRVLYNKEGVRLPHSARQQYRLGKPVKSGKLVPGDLVFFRIRKSISHVGMYIGQDKFVHAAGRGKGVRVDRLSSAYFSRRFAGARRVLGTA